MSKLQVVNVKRMKRLESDVWYVGRKGRYQASALGNPYKPQIRGVGETLPKYKRYLWEQIKKGMAGETSAVWSELVKLTESVKAGQTTKLGCWCAPRPCHAEVIAQAVEWLIAAGKL